MFIQPYFTFKRFRRVLQTILHTSSWERLQLTGLGCADDNCDGEVECGSCGWLSWIKDRSWCWEFCGEFIIFVRLENSRSGGVGLLSHRFLFTTGVDVYWKLFFWDIRNTESRLFMIKLTVDSWFVYIQASQVTGT
jgi:hypothetical protein